MRSESLSGWANPDPEALRDTTLGSLLVEEARLSHKVFATRAGIAAEPLTARTYLELLAVRAAVARTLMWGSQAGPLPLRLGPTSSSGSTPKPRCGTAASGHPASISV